MGHDPDGLEALLDLLRELTLELIATVPLKGPRLKHHRALIYRAIKATADASAELRAEARRAPSSPKPERVESPAPTPPPTAADEESEQLELRAIRAHAEVLISADPVRHRDLPELPDAQRQPLLHRGRSLLPRLPGGADR